MAKNISISGRVLLEEYVSGPEYSIECLIQRGKINIIAITGKSLEHSSNGYFVEDRHVIPANLPNSKVNLISKYVISILNIFQLDNSAAHIEIKLQNGLPILIELACRLGGDYITSDLVPLATGIDMLENVINIALDIPIKATPFFSKFAGIHLLIIQIIMKRGNLLKMEVVLL